MKELTLNGRTYLSTKRAAEVTGYTTDYVGQFARGGKVAAQQVGRNWYVAEDSIKHHKFGEAKVRMQEEESAPAPRLEVLMEEVDQEMEKEEMSPVEDAPEEKEEVSTSVDAVQEKSSDEDVLGEMQSAWHSWYKAQRSVPTKEEEVYLSKEDMEEEAQESEEIPVAINRMQTPHVSSYHEQKMEPVVEEEVAEEDVAAPVVSPVQAKRSWSGGGLAVAAAVTIIFIGSIVAGTGYVIAEREGISYAAVYQGVQDYVLGIRRVE